MPQDIKIVKYGNHERKSFSKTKEVLPLPNLIEVQKSSYKMFIEQGIQEVFEDFSPIEDFAGHFRLDFWIIESSLSPSTRKKSAVCATQRTQRPYASTFV